MLALTHYIITKGMFMEKVQTSVQPSTKQDQR